MKQQVSIAKISRPRSQEIYLRKRLFSRLDNYRKQPVIWVCGPAGSGKTTFVNSYIETRNLQAIWYQVDSGDGDPATFFHYLGLAVKKAAPRKRRPLPHLTPEYLMGIPTFSRRFFENLYSRLKIPYLVVFDNYHEVPDDSLFHELLRDGVGEAPEGMNAIIISRSEPLPVFQRMRANQLLSVISWHDLRLNLDEFKGIVRLKGQKKIQNEMITQLHSKTEGWAAGLLLVLENSKAENIATHSLNKHNPEIIFDYFASEIFQKIGKETQNILAQTALFPSLTPAMVKKLTGIHNGDRILSNLNKNNFFIERRKSNQQIVYQYHKMFREFLLSCAKELFTPKQLLKLRQKAAIILEASYKIEDAAKLFIEVGDWNRLTCLINKNARQLSLNGRTQTILGWLKEFPEEILGNSPWLSYWLGECNMFFNPPESISHYEKAFILFSKVKDLKGTILAICGIVRSYYYNGRAFERLDRWLAELDKLKKSTQFSHNQEIRDYVTSCIFLPLATRQPDHPDLYLWRERAYEILHKDVDLNLRTEMGSQLVIYSLSTGDFTGAEMIINVLHKLSKSKHATPLTVMTIKVTELSYYFHCSSHEQCDKAAKDGLSIGRHRGIRIYEVIFLGIGAANLISKGDLKEAERYLNQLTSVLNPSHNYDATFVYLMLGWYSLLKKDMSLAIKYMRKSSDHSFELGASAPNAFSNLGMAQVLHESGEFQKAHIHLKKVEHINKRMKSVLISFMYFTAKAQFAFDMGEDIKTLKYLQRAMALGREKGYFNHFLWRPEVMVRLCMKALKEGIEVDYMKKLIRRRNLIPETPPLDVEDWPWLLKIYTMGKFEVVKDEKSIQFSRKSPQKPLAMLKILIVFGGNYVNETRISDALWPDAEGDAAHHAFTTTLSRLRKLIGVEGAITLHESRLSLNPGCCWVDIQAFDRLLEEADELSGKGKQDRYMRMIEKAISMYHGNFLAGDKEEPWIILPRERLRNRFIRCLSKLGDHWEECGKYEKAVDCYSKGLDVYDLTEEFCQKLMVCYHKLGRNAEAFGVYKRFKKALSTISGLNPSSKTEQIFSNISCK